MYTLEVLISTMYKKNNEEINSLLDNMHINSDCVVVNQCDKNSVTEFKYKTYRCTAVYSTERGLSKSRNLALQYAQADIVVITDDDIQFEEGYKSNIESAFLKHPNDDILTFQLNPQKRYPLKEKKEGAFYIHKISSCEITMKRTSVQSVKFNTLFGTGSDYFLHGEEIVFLKDCLKQKKNIRYIPYKMAGFMPQSRPSTWFQGFNKNFFMDHGALYYELSHNFALLFILRFSIRKLSFYKKTIAFSEAIKSMMTGLQQYKKILDK